MINDIPTSKRSHVYNNRNLDDQYDPIGVAPFVAETLL
ncbi:hypothetical protein CLW00_12016 [Mongoliibacter ruber]|uniref:Uncharacterized protein n=1 Tax=Mongoliibacter ruber TaxID=1750599 RepID=A0A2T0WCP5_9BACT|nr:hypothetical protein CLW00_12016 [Mongoliibacter ruber]